MKGYGIIIGMTGGGFMGELAFQEGREYIFKDGGLERRIRSFIPSCFIICPLPVRSIKEGEKGYEKRINNFKLKLTGAYGIPGGKIARDLLMLFTTEAVYRKNYDEDKIKLNFKSIRDLQRSIGMKTIVESDKVLDMLKKYSGCIMNFEIEMKKEFDGQTLLFNKDDFKELRGYGEKGSKVSYYSITNVPFISKLEKLDLIRAESRRGESVLIELTLMSEFVDMVRKNAVPVDFTVYSDIQGAMMQDLYVWLVYKNYKNWKEEEIFIPKDKFIEQFGTEGEKNENMKYSRILESLEKIRKEYYENLRYKVIDDGKRREKGILFYRSPVLTKEKDIKYVPLLTRM